MTAKLTYAQDRDIRVVQVDVREIAAVRLFVKRMEHGTFMVLLALANGAVQPNITLCLHESQPTFLG